MQLQMETIALISLTATFLIVSFVSLTAKMITLDIYRDLLENGGDHETFARTNNIK